MPKFGVSIYSVNPKLASGEWTPEDCIRWMAEQGAEVIEMVPFNIDFLGDPSVIDRCKNAAAAAGVRIENFSLNANFLQLTDEEYLAALERARKYIDVAGQMGCSSMRIDCASFRRPIETNTTANFLKELPTIVKTYEDLCDYASQYGITILLENHGFHVNGADRTAMVFENVKADNFAGQLDCGNFVCVDEKPEAAVKKNIRYARTVHMKDFYIRPEDRDPGDAHLFDCANAWFRSVAKKYLRGSILAQGDLDIPAVIRAIKESGFDGSIFIEFEGMEECRYGTKVSLDNLKRIWNEV